MRRGFKNKKQNVEHQPPAEKPKKPAIPFQAHIFEKSVHLIAGTPQVVVSKQAYDFMYHLVDVAPEEVAWIGVVTRKNNIFTLGEMFIFKQEVSGAEAVISNDGITQALEELLATREDAEEIWNNIYFWGHSHVFMPANPSHIDVDQLAKFVKNTGKDWFLRGIANKLGSLKFTLYLANEGIIISDIPWILEIPVDSEQRAHIEKEYKDKVTEVPFRYQYDTKGVAQNARRFPQGPYGKKSPFMEKNFAHPPLKREATFPELPDTQSTLQTKVDSENWT